MKVLACYNIKGGVGKTATAVNLAYRCAQGGQRTLLWDLDPQAAATYYYRIEAKVKGGSERLLRKPGALAKAIRASDYEGLDVVPADFSYRDLDLDLNQAGKARKQLKRLLKTVSDDYDVVFLDCPPSISLLSDSVFGVSDALLIPTIPTALSLRTLEQLAAHLADSPTAPRLLPFFCLVDSRKKAHKEIQAEAQEARMGFLETAIPYATHVERMGDERQPVEGFAPRSLAARRYRELWDEVDELLDGGKTPKLRKKKLAELYRKPRTAQRTGIHVMTPMDPASSAAPSGSSAATERREVEFKFKLRGPEDFETLARALGHEGPLPQPVLQVNRFADSSERVWGEAGTVLRWRSEGGAEIVTAKGPTLKASGEGNLSVKAEEEFTWEAGVPESAREVWIELLNQRGETALVRRMVELLQDEPIDWIGSFENERARLGPISLPGTELELTFELDRTLFPGGVVHFEAEVELPEEQVEQAEAALIELFDQAGLPRESAPSKAKRFVALLAEASS